MTKFVAVTTTALALVLGASAASAQDKGGMYMSSSANGDQMIMGGEMGEGARVIQGNNGAAPDDCPAGSFYMVSETQVAACEGGARYSLANPESGTMMSNGEAYPEGARILIEDDMANDPSENASESTAIGEGTGSEDTGVSDNDDGAGSGSGSGGSSDNDGTGGNTSGSGGGGSSDSDGTGGNSQ